MSFVETEVADIEQAKLIISMKNDEIKSITNKMKMLEKKSNIKIAESVYQIQQQKNKFSDLEKKMQKLKQAQNQQLRKFQEAEQKLKSQYSKIKQLLNDQQKNERQLERSYKAQIYEQDLQIKEEKEKRYHLKRQYESILRLFNPKQIVACLGLSSAEEIIPYLKIVEAYKDRQQQLEQLKSQLEQHRAESLRTLEDSFTKLNSYEQVMAHLKEKNTQLQKIMIQTEKTLEQKHYELQQKSNMLRQVQIFTTEKYNQMNQQIQNLRRSVQAYERQSVSYLNSKDEQQNNLKFIFELSAQFQRKEEDYLNRIGELENLLHQLQGQKDQLSRQYHQSLNSCKQNIRSLENGIKRAEKNLLGKEEIISILTVGLKEVEAQSQLNKKELEKCKIEISEILRKKHKVQEQLKEMKEFYESKEESLLEQIEFLKNTRRSSRNSRDSNQSSRRNSNEIVTPISLEDQLEPGPNWLQLYENCLHRHNKFIRQVHYLLQKQDRRT